MIGCVVRPSREGRSSRERAARCNIEIRSGRVASGDLDPQTAHGFISEKLYIGDLNSGTWVEVGYSRGWEGYDCLTPYWANMTLAGNYYEHSVVNITVTPGDTPKFRIKKHSGTDNAWDCAIGGVAANDIDGDNTANSTVGNNFNSYEAGMESNCTSGEIGTTSNPVNVTNMEKSTNGGSSYSTSSNGLTFNLQDPAGNNSHGSWNSVGISSHNCRQH
jgi:hypothetical protein